MGELLEKLQKLELEERTVKGKLQTALADGNVADYTILKKRELEIPTEIKILEAMMQGDKVKNLEAEQIRKLNEVELAKADSKNFDLFESPKAQILRTEADKISKEALAKLVRPKIIQDELQFIGVRLSEERSRLAEMLKDV
jgi:predicted secreted protein